MKNVIIDINIITTSARHEYDERDSVAETTEDITII